LDGTYPGNTDSRLISATVELPAVNGAEEIGLRYWQWFSYSGGGNCDVGYVQISVKDEATGVWSNWANIGRGITHTSTWSQDGVDLTGYAGSTVRIAFYHTATTSTYPSNCSASSYGWYLDEVQIIKKLPEFTGDFEQGWVDWSADRGVWQIGTPTAGPDSCYAGSQCAGTELDGTYPGNTDSRLISATVELPTVIGAEEISLRFWQWFSYSGGGNCDVGYIQISVQDEATGVWSNWANIGRGITHTSIWSQDGIDLTSYAGSKVRVAFYHTATTSTYPHNCSASSYGWYVDDVQIVKKLPDFTGDFEQGWVDWSADRGVWQIGTPTAGPDSCYGGSQCAGTVLDGTYPGNTDSRLISATVELPTVIGAEEISLRFWQWFSYSGGSNCDAGYVQISVQDEISGTWSDWANISQPFSGSSTWVQNEVALTSYTGSNVRIAFYHTATTSTYPRNCSASSYGWYIDAVEIVTSIPTSAYDYSSVNFFDNSYLITQSAGFVFTPTSDLVVSALGFFDYLGDGLEENHEIGIFNATGNLLVYTVVPAGNAVRLDDDFRYVDISPLTLEAGETYTIAAFLTTQADTIGYLDVGDLTNLQGIALDTFPFRYITPSGTSLSFPTETSGASAEFILGPNFQFAQPSG
jgi:hypothetical protein